MAGKLVTRMVVQQEEAPRQQYWTSNKSNSSFHGCQIWSPLTPFMRRSLFLWTLCYRLSSFLYTSCQVQLSLSLSLSLSLCICIYLHIILLEKPIPCSISEDLV